MAQKMKNTAANGSDKKFPPEAYDYNDDVTTVTVEAIREERGIDVSAEKWKTVDALGQVVSA